MVVDGHVMAVRSYASLVIMYIIMVMVGVASLAFKAIALKTLGGTEDGVHITIEPVFRQCVGVLVGDPFGIGRKVMYVKVCARWSRTWTVMLQIPCVLP